MKNRSILTVCALLILSGLSGFSFSETAVQYAPGRLVNYHSTYDGHTYPDLSPCGGNVHISTDATNGTVTCAYPDTGITVYMVPNYTCDAPNTISGLTDPTKFCIVPPPQPIVDCSSKANTTAGPFTETCIIKHCAVPFTLSNGNEVNCPSGETMSVVPAPSPISYQGCNAVFSTRVLPFYSQPPTNVGQLNGTSDCDDTYIFDGQPASGTAGVAPVTVDKSTLGKTSDLPPAGVTVGTDPATGTGTGTGTGDCVPTPTVPCPAADSANTKDKCDVPPSCTGDAIQCAQVVQEWVSTCALGKALTTLDDTQQATLDGITNAASGAATDQKVVDNKNIFQTQMSTITGFMDSQNNSNDSNCLTDLTIQVLGHSVLLPISKLCGLLSLVRLMLHLSVDLLSMRILISPFLSNATKG